MDDRNIAEILFDKLIKEGKTSSSDGKNKKDVPSKKKPKGLLPQNTVSNTDEIKNAETSSAEKVIKEYVQNLNKTTASTIQLLIDQLKENGESSGYVQNMEQFHKKMLEFQKKMEKKINCN